MQLQAHTETGLWPARSATGDDPAGPAAAAGGTPAIPARGLTTTSPPARSMRCMNRMGPTGSVHPPKEVSDGQVSRLRWTARDHRRGPTPRREAPRLHTALAEVAATALNSDGGEWIEAADRRFSSAKPVLYEPPGARHQASQNGTTLHLPSQTPGSGGFLPSFLPKEAALRSLDVISTGHGCQLE